MSNPQKRARYQARMENAARAVLAANKVAIVNLNSPYDFQTTFHHGNLKMIRAGQRIAQALCDIPHRWTIYLAVFCESPWQKYTNAADFITPGIYRAEHLTDVIREHHTALVKEQNPNHVKSSGWIAFPYPIDFSEAQADALFSAAIEASKDYQNISPPDGYTP